MRAIVLMFDSLNRHWLSPYGNTHSHTPNFARLAERSVVFDNFWAGSMPCMPARRELHTGRHNFLHRSWGPLEPYDDSVPELLGQCGVHSHLTSDHQHYWEDGGGTYHTRYTTWEFERGQEGGAWKGVVGAVARGAEGRDRAVAQDRVNRSYMPTEAEHSQTRVVDNGLHFLERNAGADNWLLQIECFDPHEPFFAHQHYRDLFPDAAAAPDAGGGGVSGFAGDDWPNYHKVTEPDAFAERTRNRYAALLAMCDHSLGRVLDAMDEHDLWDDTMLVVNTDHGFLLGEHGWWAKNAMPWYNELVHIPFFLWDPRTRRQGERCDALAQTIDIGPTLLGLFGQSATADMQGRDLHGAVTTGTVERAGALFGAHGGHVNVTDGRYVYLRGPATETNAPLADYTMMPTRMRARYPVEELRDWTVGPSFGFTKGLPTMRIDTAHRAPGVHRYGTQLFDLADDPGQRHPVADDEAELRMLRLLQQRMRDSDAPVEQFTRLGIPYDEPPTRDHLRAAADRDRAVAVAEPLPPLDRLRAPAVVTMPLAQVLQDPRLRRVVERCTPGLAHTEPVNVRASASLWDLARSADLTATELQALDEGFAAV